MFVIWLRRVERLLSLAINQLISLILHFFIVAAKIILLGISWDTLFLMNVSF